MSFWGILNGKKNHGDIDEEEPIDGYDPNILTDITDNETSGNGGFSIDPVRPAAAASGTVNVKLLSPKSHTEAVSIADELMNKCIVVLDVSNLATESAMRLIDFLSGVIHVLGGKMRKTNNGTFVVAPNGVDIGDLMPDVNDGE